MVSKLRIIYMQTDRMQRATHQLLVVVLRAPQEDHDRGCIVDDGLVWTGALSLPSRVGLAREPLRAQIRSSWA